MGGLGKGISVEVEMKMVLSLHASLVGTVEWRVKSVGKGRAGTEALPVVEVMVSVGSVCSVVTLCVVACSV